MKLSIMLSYIIGITLILSVEGRTPAMKKERPSRSTKSVRDKNLNNKGGKENNSDLLKSSRVDGTALSQSYQSTSSSLQELDSIRAVVYYDDDTFVITKSDLKRPGIDGAYRSLDDRIMESLLYGESKKYKMLPSREQVDKHLQAVQQDNNLTREELYNIFRAAGYTPEEGKEQFGRLSAISSLIDYRIRSRLIIPERDIQAYYDEHPVWQEPQYQIQRAFVSAPNNKKATYKKELEQFFKSGLGSFEIVWEEPFWMPYDQIAESWNFIKDMNVNEIRIAQETPQGFELVKLSAKKERRQKPLEERYREIADILRRPKYEELLADYKKSLLENASIDYFDDEEPELSSVS